MHRLKLGPITSQPCYRSLPCIMSTCSERKVRFELLTGVDPISDTAGHLRVALNVRLQPTDTVRSIMNEIRQQSPKAAIIKHLATNKNKTMNNPC